MGTSPRFVIPPDIGEPESRISPAEQDLKKVGATSRSAQRKPHADPKDDSVDRSFLMTLLRCLSACHS